MPEIHLYKPLEIISVGDDDTTSKPYSVKDENQTIADMNITSNESNVATNISSNNDDGASSAGKNVIQHHLVTVALIATALFSTRNY